MTDLAEDELLTEIRIPAQPAGVGMAYRRLEQPASGYSIVGVAAVVGRTGGSVTTARIGITGVGDVAYRASAVEAALHRHERRRRGDRRGGGPRGRWGHGRRRTSTPTRCYRAEMARVDVRRAIEAALAAAD